MLSVKEARKMNNIKQIEVIYDNRLIGRLALTKEGLCAFEYSAEWLGSGFSISPFEFPLKSGVFIAKPRPFEGGFGVFDDCLPDGWGLVILDRYLQQKGINPRTLTLLDRLALVGSTGRGALEFRPDHSVVTRQDYADFEKLHWKQSKYWIVTIIWAKVLRSFNIAVVHLEVHDPKSSFAIITRSGW